MEIISRVHGAFERFIAFLEVTGLHGFDLLTARPGGGGEGLPYETDGDARCLA